jgi:hypothetical protein
MRSTAYSEKLCNVAVYEHILISCNYEQLLLHKRLSSAVADVCLTDLFMHTCVCIYIYTCICEYRYLGLCCC